MEHTESTAVGCVIMASGRAVRFGSNKLLADFGGAPSSSGRWTQQRRPPSRPGWW